MISSRAVGWRRSRPSAMPTWWQGVPQTAPDHAERLAACALGMLDIIEEFRATSGHPLELRIGLHRGRGGRGHRHHAFCLRPVGESVNLAARLESSSEPGRIQVSEAFRAGSEQTCVFESRGQVTQKSDRPRPTGWSGCIRGPCVLSDPRPLTSSAPPVGARLTTMDLDEESGSLAWRPRGTAAPHCADLAWVAMPSVICDPEEAPSSGIS